MVLAAVTPGHTVRLRLTADQKLLLRDRDGKIALDVLRHLVGALATLAAQTGGIGPDKFPFTGHAIQAVARKRGHEVGVKRCYEMKRRLVDAAVIEASGSYRQPYTNNAAFTGYRVEVFSFARGVLGAIIGTAKHAAEALTYGGRLRLQPPVGRGRLVKLERKRRCWQHPVFGDYEGLPPPELTARQRRSWRSQDERSRRWR